MTLVRIQSSFLLNDRFELPTDGLDKAVAGYQKAWKKVEKKIIEGLEKVTGLTFFPNVIDCYIANIRFKGNISNPLIIGGAYTPAKFVFVLTHELAHLLADDNKQDYNWHEVAKKLYPKEEKFVAYHIMTNAIQEALYTDVMKNTDLVIQFIEMSDELYLGETHKPALDIVEGEGYKAILKKFKDNQFKTTKKFA